MVTLAQGGKDEFPLRTIDGPYRCRKEAFAAAVAGRIGGNAAADEISDDRSRDAGLSRAAWCHMNLRAGVGHILSADWNGWFD
jgi:hypothetical protein